MTRLPDATADAVVAVVEAVVCGRGLSTLQHVAEFVDMPVTTVEAALDLAVDLGLVTVTGTTFEDSSPLSRLLVTPVLDQKSALLRITVESYEPFRVFRARLHESGETTTSAAKQTKALLHLTEHHEVIKQTLVSLGTYCGSLRDTGGGQYEVRFEFEGELVNRLRSAVSELGEAELRVRDWLSEQARAYVDAASVLGPLADAYLKVAQGDSRGAVVTAGNAIESYLVQLAADLSVNVATAPGLGAKVAEFEKAKKLPKKLLAVGRYLGNIRNAADHGVDTEIAVAWTIRDGTGEDYLRVAITFIESTLDCKNHVFGL